MAETHALKLQLPWVEKYRPHVLNDIVGNVETIERLKVISANGNMPHLIISGLPGIGKTTSVHCLAHELLGYKYSEAVLELNASDDRGIEVVRNKIKQFAQKKVQLPQGRHKIIILDEADSMTAGAQQALRRTMEIYSNTTRFAFACNQSNKIIEPLQSRCAILRYGRLQDEEVLKRLLEIIDKEDVKYTNDGLEALIFTAEGDMRQAVNNLQSTVAGFGLVNSENVFQIVDSPHPLIIKGIILSAITGKFDESLDTLAQLWEKGYSAIDVASTSFKVTKNMTEISEAKRLEVMKEIGLTHMRVLEGVGTALIDNTTNDVVDVWRKLREVLGGVGRQVNVLLWVVNLQLFFVKLNTGPSVVVTSLQLGVESLFQFLVERGDPQCWNDGGVLESGVGSGDLCGERVTLFVGHHLVKAAVDDDSVLQLGLVFRLESLLDQMVDGLALSEQVLDLGSLVGSGL
ncbi:hypothetical protein WICPIJ_001727 [Wickerhamomyces pijperi]|uniref:AAA+ ATPase domain-containing protein n=1 Tax=Wickerhamomyces pijperi TaxID=599730 RepID=A0A9P8TQI7_WICPI|nr:hypothetical protein WICPIJ_001727 [Wickerhamomyces pijperi]